MSEGVALLGAVVWVVALVVTWARRPRPGGRAKAGRRWVIAALVASAGTALVGAMLSLLVQWPTAPWSGISLTVVLVPLALVAGRWGRTSALGDVVLRRTVVGVGLVAMVALLFVLVVVGLGRVPEAPARSAVELSLVAACLAVLLAFPARSWLVRRAERWVHGAVRSPDEAWRAFGAGFSRSVPMDELLLQLAESLKRSMRLTGIEIWTGSSGHLAVAVSLPDQAPRTLEVDGTSRAVVVRAHAQGNAWTRTWLPSLLEGRQESVLRVVSVAHLGELLGLLVLQRGGSDEPFTEAEDRALVDLARQLGLALHNVGLDSALQDSLRQLENRNAELAASRTRVVTAADEARRLIERDLHDGAQQHLVALAVKIGLVTSLMPRDHDAAAGLVGELPGDVRRTLGELRELAHGIYPPLLLHRGLAEALGAAAGRAALPTSIEARGVGRFEPEIEAAVYFCCLEAIQNAGKHAGPGATVAVVLANPPGALTFWVTDDGTGFDAEAHSDGHGFVNMRDRLGAFAGTLVVTSAPGAGTQIVGSLPVALPAGATIHQAAPAEVDPPIRAQARRDGAPPDAPPTSA